MRTWLKFAFKVPADLTLNFDVQKPVSSVSEFICVHYFQDGRKTRPYILSLSESIVLSSN